MDRARMLELRLAFLWPGSNQVSFLDVQRALARSVVGATRQMATQYTEEKCVCFI